jgi:hypothetical protein
MTTRPIGAHTFKIFETKKQALSPTIGPEAQNKQNTHELVRVFRFKKGLIAAELSC